MNWFDLLAAIGLGFAFPVIVICLIRKIFFRKSLFGKLFGWYFFSVGVSLFISSVLTGFPILWLVLGAIFIGVGWWAAHRKTKQAPKQLVCPNGCNIAQEGTKYCGLCGTRLIQK